MSFLRPLALSSCLFLGACTATHSEPAAPAAPAARPATWAKPVTLDGVPNLHQVSPTLYRSAQPNRDGLARVEKLGVRTVVNLRSFHSDADELKGTGLAAAHLSMKAWHPEREDVIAFLKIVADPKQTPVLVHCQHGADRTGTLCACYRVIVQGWTKEEAIREMTDGGFGFHAIWQNLPDWIANLDVEAIRRELGLTKR